MSSNSNKVSSKEATFSWKNDSWVKPYLSRYKKTLCLAIFLGVLTIGFAAALMFTAGLLIGQSAEMPYSILLLGTPLLCVRIFGIGKPLLQYAERLTSHDWVLRMTSSLRVRLYRSFESNGIFFHSLYRLGDALGLLAEDIGHIQNLYLRTIFPTVIAWILGALLVIGFGCFTWWMGILVLLLLLVELIIVPLISVSVNGARLAQHKSLKASLYTEVTDDVLGITDWILSGRFSDYLSHHKKTQQKLRALEHAGHTFDKKRDILLQVFFGLGAVVVLFWAAMQFGGQTGGNSNWILAFVLGYFPLIDAFAPLSAAATEARSHQDSIERLNNLPQIEEDATAATLQHETDRALDVSEPEAGGSDASVPGASVSNGSASDVSSSASSKSSTITPDVKQNPCDVILENVSFSYPGSTRLLIDNLSLRIHAGEKVAVLGRSGAGKSTLASLIRGDLIPTSGQVLISEQVHEKEHISNDTPHTPNDASRIPNDAPHTPNNAALFPTCTLDDNAARYFGVIQQRTYLFNATLRENLRIGNPNASDELLIKTLHNVGLKALFERLPKGLDTLVNEAGFGFSGGERHRIALARVLLQDAPIIILDEPMVGLDPETEQQVLEAIFSTLKDKTIIMITHHLQGISFMDRVLFLNQGNLRLDGSPEKLKETNSYFRRLLALENYS